MRRPFWYAIILAAICTIIAAVFAARRFSDQKDIAQIQALAKYIFVFQGKYQEMAVRDENANGVGEYAYIGTKTEPFIRPTAFQRPLMDSYAGLLSDARSSQLDVCSMLPFVDSTGRVVFSSKRVDEEKVLSEKEKKSQCRVSEARWCVRITKSDSGLSWFVIGGGTIVGYGLWEESVLNRELIGPDEDRLLDLGERPDFGFDVGGHMVFRWK